MASPDLHIDVTHPSTKLMKLGSAEETLATVGEAVQKLWANTYVVVCHEITFAPTALLLLQPQFESGVLFLEVEKVSVCK